MNLHGTVRGAITSVNPDQQIVWKRSIAPTVGANFRQQPQYAPDVIVGAQIQALTGKDLKHELLQNIQGIVRAVYLFGNVQGVSRPDAKGGDLLVFPQNLSGVVQTWLVVAVLETWEVEFTGWCKVAVVLQQ